jgi:hypothetical protein
MALSGRYASSQDQTDSLSYSRDHVNAKAESQAKCAHLNHRHVLFLCFQVDHLWTIRFLRFVCCKTKADRQVGVRIHNATQICYTMVVIASK